MIFYRMEQIKKISDKLFEEIYEKIKDKKIIIFGEIHGTKEIPKILSQFFFKLAKQENFNVCLEIPSDFQNNIEDFFKNKEFDDGRNSLEYFNLIQSLNNINKEYDKNIKIFYIDVLLYEKISQNEREKIMAENIIKSLEDKKVFVILGNVHASKIPIKFQDINIITTGTRLYKKLNGEMFSINFVSKKGSFYNFGIKEINNNYHDDSFNKGFDHVIQLASTTPCSFLF